MAAYYDGQCRREQRVLQVLTSLAALATAAYCFSFYDDLLMMGVGGFALLIYAINTVATFNVRLL